MSQELPLSWSQLAILATLQLLIFGVMFGLFFWFNRKVLKSPGSLQTLGLTIGSVVFLGIAYEFFRAWKPSSELSWHEIWVFLMARMARGSLLRYAFIGLVLAIFILGFRQGLSREPDQSHPR